MTNHFMRAGAVALTVGLFAGLACANAAPRFPLNGVAGNASAAETVRYGHRHYAPYAYQYAPQDYASSSYRYRPYAGGADEYREMQRLFPETNWPPSLRYYER
jgi:hypothetical protein